MQTRQAGRTEVERKRMIRTRDAKGAVVVVSLALIAACGGLAGPAASPAGDLGASPVPTATSTPTEQSPSSTTARTSSSEITTTVTATPSSSAEPTATATPRLSERVGQRFTGFIPLDDPPHIAAPDADHLSDDTLVLGLEWQGEARAYPVHMIRSPHIVNETVGGRHLLVTY